MVKLCMSMKHTTLCTLSIAFILASHTCTFAIDHTEQERVEPPKAAPVEDAEYEQDQGKPQCSLAEI
jgi:hypothetical protein